MKKPFYFYGNGKSPAELHPLRGPNEVAYLVLPMSEAAKDLALSEAESVIKVTLDSGIRNPRVIGTAVLDALAKAARGDTIRTPKDDPSTEFTAPPADVFLEQLNKAIEWHYQNTHDPYGIDHNAISIMSSIRIAWAIANGLKCRKLVTERKEAVS